MISAKKSFIGFLSVRLLGQKVDGFGITTPEDKIKAIHDLDFPERLSELETYLSLSGSLRQYIKFYANIVRPLQD